MLEACRFMNSARNCIPLIRLRFIEIVIQQALFRLGLGSAINLMQMIVEIVIRWAYLRLD